MSVLDANYNWQLFICVENWLVILVTLDQSGWIALPANYKCIWCRECVCSSMSGANWPRMWWMVCLYGVSLDKHITGVSGVGLHAFLSLVTSQWARWSL